MTRTETDYIGTRQIPAEALYGIHTLRAMENFPGNERVHLEWYKAMGTTKLACYITFAAFKKSVLLKAPEKAGLLRLMSDEVVQALEQAAGEVASGLWFDQFLVPANQGGAGTSINMNVNEIIANRALQILGNPLGTYQIIDPVEHANIYQSTNDVVPTALTIAVMRLLNQLEEQVNVTRTCTEKLETTWRNVLRMGYTQLQEAVPTSYGKLFSTYSEALSRDWWRVSKCFERIKIVNLGGSAIGTSVAVPRFFVMEVVQHLQHISQLPVTRSENLPDATSNLDAFVEIHATLKAHAVNLEKMVNDLRLLASDFSHRREIQLPMVQVGSSIMPSKINPVIVEYVVSVVHKIYSNDQLITALCGQSCLELNAYLPAIGDALLNSLTLLINANISIAQRLLTGLTINESVALENLYRSPSITTVLSPAIGYHKAAEMARWMREHKTTVYEANTHFGFLTEPDLLYWLSAPNLLKNGFSVTELPKP